MTKQAIDTLFGILGMIFVFPFKVIVYYGVISSLPSQPWWLWFAFNGFIIAALLLSAMKVVVEISNKE